jgi:hypothetical protein
MLTAGSPACEASRSVCFQFLEIIWAFDTVGLLSFLLQDELMMINAIASIPDILKRFVFIFPDWILLVSITNPAPGYCLRRSL